MTRTPPTGSRGVPAEPVLYSISREASGPRTQIRFSRSLGPSPQRTPVSVHELLHAAHEKRGKNNPKQVRTRRQVGRVHPPPTPIPTPTISLYATSKNKMMAPEYIPYKSLGVCTVPAWTSASATPSASIRASTMPPKATGASEVRVPVNVASVADRAAATTTAAEAASSTTAHEQLPSATLAGPEYATHVSGVVARARRLFTAAQTKLMSTSAARVGAASRAADSSSKKPFAVITSVVEGLIMELEAAVSRSTLHELRASDFADALAKETSKYVWLKQTLEARDRTIASLREQLDLRVVQESEVEQDEPAPADASASQTVATFRPDEEHMEPRESQGEINSESASTLSLMASDVDSDAASASSEELDNAGIFAGAGDKQHEKRCPIAELSENEDKEETAMVLAALDVRDLIETETKLSKTMPKLHARYKKTLRALVQLQTIDPTLFATLNATSLNRCLRRVGLSLVKTPSFGNCQFEALLEAALGFSLNQLYEVAHARNADPALMLRYDWAVDALGLLKRAIAACGVNASKQYDVESLVAAVLESGQECVDDLPYDDPQAICENRAILNGYWHAIANNSSRIREQIPWKEWGNSLSLFQACKVLGRPIHLLKLLARSKAGASFQRFAPVNPSGPASMFKSCIDSCGESFEEWTQVLLDDVEAADTDPCLMPLVLVLEGNHYQSAIVDPSALASIEQLLGKMRGKVPGTMENNTPGEKPVTAKALPLTPSTCSLESSAAESRSTTLESSKPSQSAASPSPSTSSCSSKTTRPCDPLRKGTKGLSSELKPNPEALPDPMATRVRNTLGVAGTSRADPPVKDETVASARGNGLGSSRIKVKASCGAAASNLSTVTKTVHQAASTPATTKCVKPRVAVVAAGGSGSTTARKTTAPSDASSAEGPKDPNEVKDAKGSSVLKKKKTKQALEKPRWR